jgi:LPS-assembly lipoprotein
MWWSRDDTAIYRTTRTLARVCPMLLAAALLAGCFQPLYGERTVTGTPAMSEKLSTIEVIPIDLPNGSPEARIGLELRNALLFDLNGGAGPSNPAYRLKINMAVSRQQVIVDVFTYRPDIENLGIDASYSLVEIATGKVVLTGQTFARVSYDIPGQQQRFARTRGMRDAENRAAKTLAEQIRSRLASYFVAGA